jgi:hypothetical protein
VHREIEALERDLLAAYRPPLSIDRRPDFIAASSTLKEARELDAAGLRYGALFRYLLAAQRIAAIRSDVRPFDTARMAAEIRSVQARLAASETDPALGDLFVEIAAATAEDTTATSQVLATTVLTDVFPRYFAAADGRATTEDETFAAGHVAASEKSRAAESIGGPGAASSPGTPVTVTLVRWPYT